MTDPENADERIDAALRAWGEQARAAAGRVGPAPVRLAPSRWAPRSRRLVAVAGAVAAAAAVAITSTVITTGGTDHSSTAADRSSSDGATKQVTYRYLAVRVPAGWRIEDARCGSPQGDTVMLPIFTVACYVSPKPGVTWVSFEPLENHSDAIPHATTKRITVGGHPATEQIGVQNGDAVIRVVVPAARARVTVRSPHAASAQRIAASASVVDHDSNGCPAESPYRPLTTGAKPARAGADQTLVPGDPTSMAVCAYADSLLVHGVSVPTGELATDLAILRALPPGLSMGTTGNSTSSCTAPADPAASLDRTDQGWFALLVRYRSGPDLILRARIGLCGYLGVSNGSRGGQDFPGLARFLGDTTLVGSSYPPTVRPVH